MPSHPEHECQRQAGGCRLIYCRKYPVIQGKLGAGENQYYAEYLVVPMDNAVKALKFSAEIELMADRL